ncbi:MAG: hypothetical protein WBI55_00150 [Eubacteriales bacterium]|jgi:hypothetical protein|nr:hypothetical protein [Clostridiales bacterium]
MKKIIAIIIAFVLILSMVLSFASCKDDSKGKDDDTKSVTESDADGAGTGDSEEASEKDTEGDTTEEKPKEEYDFSKVTPVGTSGAVYAGAPDGFQYLSESDMYIVFDITKENPVFALRGSYVDKSGNVKSGNLYCNSVVEGFTEVGVDKDRCKEIGISVKAEEYANAIELWIYYTSLPEDFGGKLKLYGVECGTENEKWVEYELLDVGEPAQNVNGVYFRTSTGSNALTVGDKIIVTFDMSLSQMYGLKATYTDENGAASYCNIVCFGEDYKDTPFDGSATYQYFNNYGIYQTDADRLGLLCELEEGESYTIVTFTVQEVKISPFTFYGCVDANETYGWITYTVS